MIWQVKILIEQVEKFVINSISNGIPEIIGSLEYDQNLSLGGFILPHLVGIEVTRDISKIPR